MTTLIQNGFVIDPANRVQGKLNLLIENGKILSVSEDAVPSDRIIDAAGKIVCPGFIDVHMHEDPVLENGHLYSDPDRSIFHCMLRMGVTTAVAGNCGDNACDPSEYLDIVDRDGCAVNVAMLAGHSYFRYKNGVSDKYAPAPKDTILLMKDQLEKALDNGCCGISYGIRYVPGITKEELLCTAEACRASHKPIAAHVRDDADAIFSSAKEFLDIAQELHIPAEFSHIGSMCGFGQTEDFLRLVDTYRMNGLDVSCDCYPYSAFSTSIGSTTYDEGWLDRYHCGYDVLEICEGDYKGQRCTEEIFRKVRKEHPDYETVCYVMKEEEIRTALRHPNVMLGSDGVLSEGNGHPRAAGAFPRFLREFAKSGILTWYEAIEKMTSLPAERMQLKSKGRLNAGADADIVIFDPEAIRDNATFASPVTPPDGICSVLIGGEIVLRNGEILRDDLGRSVRV